MMSDSMSRVFSPSLSCGAKCLSVSSARPRRSSLGQLFGKPVESLVQPLALRGAGGLDVPLRDHSITRRVFKNAAATFLFSFFFLNALRDFQIAPYNWEYIFFFLRSTYRFVAILVEAEFLCELSDREGVGKVLLVGEHQQNGAFQLILHQLRRGEKEMKKSGT